MGSKAEEPVPMSAFFDLMKGTSDAGRCYSIISSRAGQRLYATVNGRLGIASRHTKVGDKVCKFNGAPLLYILRLVPDRETEVYRLVSDTFIHGLMHGEAAELEGTEQDFLLE